MKQLVARRGILFVLVVLTLLPSLQLRGETSSLKFKHLSKDKGLSSNEVNVIVKDSTGFLWIGTGNGLNRFDGYQVTNFYHNPEDNTTIKGNGVMSLFVDPKGKLWVGTNFGVSLYNQKTNSFFGVGERNEANFTYSIKKFSDHEIVACSPSQFIKYDINTLKRDTIANIDWLNLGTDDRSMLQFYIDQQGYYWVFTLHYMLKFKMSDRSQFEIFNHRCRAIHKIKTDTNGKVWVVASNGIFNFLPEQNLITEYNPANTTNLFRQEIWDIEFESPDVMWFSTTSSGLYRYNISKNESEIFRYNILDNTSIGNDNVRTLFIFNEGALMIGSQHAGVDYTNLKNPKKFHIIGTGSLPGNSLSYNVVSCIEEENDNKLWIGTDGFGLNLMDLKKQTIEKDLFPKNSELDKIAKYILSVGKDSCGNIWFGGHEIPIVKYQPSEKKWSIVAYKCGNKSCTGIHQVRKIITDSEGEGLVCDQSSWTLDADVKNVFHSFDLGSLSSNNSNNYVLTLLEKNPSEIWVGTYGGLLIFDSKKFTVKKAFYHIPNDESSLSNNWIYSIFKDRDQNMWFGTSQGLNLFNPIDSTFSHFGKKEGFASEEINSIQDDDAGTLWLGTDNGLTKFVPSTKAIFNYSIDDGLPSNVFFKGASLKRKNGDLYFGSSNGVVYFNPNEINPDTVPIHMAITNVQLFFEDIDLNDFISKKTGAISFNHNQSTISFKYAGLNYLSNNANRYYYQLVGYQNNWIDVENRREAVFTNLDPGNYRFLVKCTNKDGIASSNIASINFTILPPWWKTTWFRIVSILFIILFIWAIFRLRLRQIRLQKIELEKLVKVRTKELHQKNYELELRQLQIEKQDEEVREKNIQLDELNKSKDKFFSIIAHDLKNPFGVIIGLSSLIVDKELDLSQEDQKKIIQNIHESTEKIYNLLENLLLWSRSQLNRINITPSFYNLTNQIYQVMSYLEEFSTVKNIKLVFEGNKEVIVYADIQMIETVIRNLITNAIKFSHSNENVRIELLSDDDKAICSIADRGIGMTRSTNRNLIKIDEVKSTEGTQGEKGTGLGLNLCLDFLEKNKGVIWVESLPNEGTTFYFTLPAKTDHST